MLYRIVLSYASLSGGFLSIVFYESATSSGSTMVDHVTKVIEAHRVLQRCTRTTSRGRACCAMSKNIFDAAVTSSI